MRRRVVQVEFAEESLLKLFFQFSRMTDSNNS